MTLFECGAARSADGDEWCARGRGECERPRLRAVGWTTAVDCDHDACATFQLARKVGQR